MFVPSWSKGVPELPAQRIQRGEHPVLAGLRGPQEGEQPRAGGGEGAPHLRGLHLDPVAQGGVAGLAGPRDRQPQHDRAHDAHLRRSSNPDLHTDAQRLISEVGIVEVKLEMELGVTMLYMGRKQKRNRGFFLYFL